MAPAKELFTLTGWKVLLTGATAGLGRRFAEALSAAGATVALVGRRAELEEVVAVPGDLADPETVPALAERAGEAVGDIDVLVNNAAYITGGVKAQDESPAEIHSILNVNLVSPITLAQHLFPHWQERGSGTVANVTSIVARVGIARLPQATYAATKGGLESITREWAAQWARFGIRANCLAPGFFESEITGDIIHHEKIQDWILGNTLLPRHGNPDEFVGALLYLASDASSYLTGQTLVVDGDWTAHRHRSRVLRVGGELVAQHPAQQLPCFAVRERSTFNYHGRHA